MEHIERTHPLGVSFGQVVVDGDHMNALACQCVQEDREGSHEGLAFTGGHLGNLAGIQHDTADQLHVVVDHVPGDAVAAGHPAVLPDGVIAVDGDEVVRSGEGAVEVGRLDLDGRIFRKSAGGGLHDGEGPRENLLQNLLDLFVDGLDQFVLLGGELLLAGHLDLHVGELLLNLGHLLLFRGDMIGDQLPESRGGLSQRVVRKFIYLFVFSFTGVYNRGHLLQIPVRLAAKKFLEKICH